MKQFLYLDYDVINSIIAQSERGLITQFSQETEEGASNQHSKEGQGNISPDAGGSLLKFAKAEASLSLQGSIGKKTAYITRREM